MSPYRPFSQTALPVFTPDNLPSVILHCVAIEETRILVSSLSGLNPASDTQGMIINHLFNLTKPQFPHKSPGNFSLACIRQPKLPAITRMMKEMFLNLWKLLLAITCAKQAFESCLKYGQIRTMLLLCHFRPSSTHGYVYTDTFLLPTPSSLILYKKIYKD